mmetsp:Transcript_39768/g.105343  ORF Transcript_39768/g.105343 Transcript_39768/m.105343 type:complete len:94 (-) Transcript_39768:193-474(-)
MSVNRVFLKGRLLTDRWMRSSATSYIDDLLALSSNHDHRSMIDVMEKEDFDFDWTVIDISQELQCRSSRTSCHGQHFEGQRVGRCVRAVFLTP